MKLTLIAIIVSTLSFSSFAAMTVSDANKALGKAEFNHQRNDNNPNATQEQREDSRDALSQALSDRRDAIRQKKDSMKHTGNLMAPGTQAPTVNYQGTDSNKAPYSGVSSRPASGPGTTVNAMTPGTLSPTATYAEINTSTNKTPYAGISQRPGMTPNVMNPGTLAPTATYAEVNTNKTPYAGVSTRPATGVINTTVDRPDTTPGTATAVIDTSIDRPDVGTINVSVSTMDPNTPVSVTVNGVTSETTAGVIAGMDPSVQVAVPHVDALIDSHKGGNHSHDKGTSHGGSDGRGADNAHSHTFGGHGYGADNSHSEGFGGHSHFH